MECFRKNSGRLPRSTGQGQAAVGVWHGRKHHEKAGGPSFALFAKGGIRDRRIEIRGIPPFAKKREGWGTRRFVALSAEDKKCLVSYPAGRQRR
jgi:hypothetical protein